MKTPLQMAGMLLCLALAACAPKPNYLYVDPSGGPARVELRSTQGIFTRTETAMALADCGFYRLPGGGGVVAGAPPEEIWRVMSLSPEQTVFEIRYGVVPKGFTQVTPASGLPPPLEADTPYVVECSGDAIGITEFRVSR